MKNRTAKVEGIDEARGGYGECEMLKRRKHVKGCDRVKVGRISLEEGERTRKRGMDGDGRGDDRFERKVDNVKVSEIGWKREDLSLIINRATKVLKSMREMSEGEGEREGAFDGEPSKKREKGSRWG